MSAPAKYLLIGGLLASALVILLLAGSISSGDPGVLARGDGLIPGSFIVILNDGVDADLEVPGIEKGNGFTASHLYSHALSGFAAELSERQVAALLADPRVNNVVPDHEFSITDTTPTGVDRIDAEGSSPPGGGDYSSVRIAIIDTGIDPAHPDLNVDPACSFSAQGGSSADGHGHGTHVAGSAAAIAGNGIGVKGVAPGATLCAVRVLDNAGN